jgi:hypothetical protein
LVIEPWNVTTPGVQLGVGDGAPVDAAVAVAVAVAAATMMASERINRAAFDTFMPVVLFCAPVFSDFPAKTETQLTLCDSAARILSRGFQKTQPEYFTARKMGRIQALKIAVISRRAAIAL